MDRYVLIAVALSCGLIGYSMFNAAGEVGKARAKASVELTKEKWRLEHKCEQ